MPGLSLNFHFFSNLFILSDRFKILSLIFHIFIIICLGVTLFILLMHYQSADLNISLILGIFQLFSIAPPLFTKRFLELLNISRSL